MKKKFTTKQLEKGIKIPKGSKLVATTETKGGAVIEFQKKFIPKKKK